jgi:hypothetical protein
MTQKGKKQGGKFHILKYWMFSLGCCNLEALQIGQFFSSKNLNFFSTGKLNNFGHQNLDLDPDSNRIRDPVPDSGSGSGSGLSES